VAPCKHVTNSIWVMVSIRMKPMINRALNHLHQLPIEATEPSRAEPQSQEKAVGVTRTAFFLRALNPGRATN